MLKARLTLTAVCVLAALACGCAPDRSPFAWPASGSEPSADQVKLAAAAWPAEFERTFFMTIQVRGRKMSTPGVVGRKAGVVRVTTADFAGVLADVRSDGTQTEVMRLMPGLDRQLTEMLARDTALTLRPPAPLDSLQSTRGVLTLDRQDASGQRLTYVFGTDGRVQLLEVRGGPRGSLFVQYADYDGQGRWKELNVCRPRYYRVQLTFDGDNP